MFGAASHWENFPSCLVFIVTSESTSTFARLQLNKLEPSQRPAAQSSLAGPLPLRLLLLLERLPVDATRHHLFHPRALLQAGWSFLREFCSTSGSSPISGLWCRRLPYLTYLVIPSDQPAVFSVSTLEVSWTSIVYMVTYIPLIFPASWFLQKKVRRRWTTRHLSNERFPQIPMDTGIFEQSPRKYLEKRTQMKPVKSGCPVNRIQCKPNSSKPQWSKP